MQRYREENREHILAQRREYVKEYNKTHKEQRNANHQRRRAWKRGCAVEKVTAKQIAELYQRQRGRCAACSESISKRYHRDHIMPLKLGGAHSIQNLQLLCPECNLRKKDKHPDEWAAQLGKLFV